MHIIPEFSHRASLADLQLIFKPTMRLCNQRLWVYLQKSFLWREPYQTHCGDTFATDLAFRSRCIFTECHRWRCRLIPCIQGALGDFFTFPVQSRTYGVRYNAGDGGCTTIRESHITARGRAVEQSIGISYHAAVVFKRMTPRTGGRRISSHCYDDIIYVLFSLVGVAIFLIMRCLILLLIERLGFQMKDNFFQYLT